MKRLELLSSLVGRFNRCSYLEIGVFDGEHFRKMLGPAWALAVDPEPNMPWLETFFWRFNAFRRPSRRYISKTSDAYFAKPHRWTIQHGIDVAFIDGLHTAEQVVVDVRNTLKWLNPGGFIVLHDTNPMHAGMAHPTWSYEQAKADYRAGLVDPWSWEWCGDVWKAVLRIRMEIGGLRVHTLADDYGLTVIWREQGGGVWTGPGKAIDELGYDDLAADREDWLQIVSDDEFMAKLGD